MTKEKKNGLTYKLSKGKTYFLIPILLLLAVLPILVRCHVYNPHLDAYVWNPDNAGPAADIFLYYRAALICVAGAAMLLLLIYRSAGHHLHLKEVPVSLYLLLSYAGLCILSAFMSTDKYFTIHGIWEQFESIFVLLSYVTITVYVFTVVNSEKDMKAIMSWLQISTVILCIFGVFQLVSFDLWNTPIGKSLVFPNHLPYKMERTVESGRVYFSFYNSNYVGLFISLVMPIFLTLFFFTSERKRKIGYGFLILILTLCLFGSMAKNGILAVGAAIFLSFLFYRKRLIKIWKWFIVSISLLCISALVFLICTGNPIFDNVKNALKAEKHIPCLTELRTGKDDVTVVYNKQELKIRLLKDEKGGIFCDFKDQRGTLVKGVYDEIQQEYYFEDTRFSAIRVSAASIGGLLGIEVTIDGKDWLFTNESEDGSWYYVNRVGKLCKLHTAPSFLFTGYEGLFSGRGYIWSRSIPLLYKYFPLGSGPDTFQLAFPQTDYVMAYNSGYEDTLITKPHNLYIQIGVQTGLLSLLAFLSFYAVYFISSIRLYAKNKFITFPSQAGCGIFIGTVGYMLSSLANDSTVCVSPYFWILIGLGLAINQKLVSDKNGTYVYKK